MVPAQLPGQLDGKLCRLGNTVQYRTYGDADHEAGLTTAYPGLVTWLRDGQHGRNCTRSCAV